MTVDSTRRADPVRLAAAARSILACPQDVQLVVDGVDDIMEGLNDPEEGGLDLRDIDGRPVFTCPAGTPLALAAADGRKALVTLTSGLGPPGSPSRSASIALAGRLAVADREECTCCDRVRDTVCLELEYVVLTHPSTEPGEQVQLRVPLTAYSSPVHQLNSGFLQRSVEHANNCHQDELRQAIATTTDTRLRDIVGVHLAGLRPDRVDIRWVDITGAHAHTLEFGRSATTPAELGLLLRDHLHAGMC